jgi:hypothetical protein
MAGQQLISYLHDDDDDDDEGGRGEEERKNYNYHIKIIHYTQTGAF